MLVLEKQSIGFLNSNKRPLVNFEDVVVFSSNIYNPQGLIKCTKNIKRPKQSISVGHDGGRLSKNNYTQDYKNYPTQLLDFKNNQENVHPTQKPVPLMEYLIKTYTNEKETVLDFTMGSGTTGVAACNLNRSFIGIELDPEYFKIAQKRIATAEDQISF